MGIDARLPVLVYKIMYQNILGGICMYSSLHPDILHFVSKKCPSNWAHDDIVDNYYLQFIKAGSVNYNVDGNEFCAAQGDVVFLKPGNKRKAETAGMECVVINFLLPEGEDIDLPVVFGIGGLESYQFYFEDLVYEWLQRNPGYKLKCQATLMMILYKLIYERNQGRKNKHVEAMKQYIMQNYSEKLTIKLVADTVGLNSVYCGALFKKVENCSISEFITKVRINRAMDLLETDGYSIADIAELTGFIDLYYFSNVFKKEVGVSPSTYRKSLGNIL